MAKGRFVTGGSKLRNSLVVSGPYTKVFENFVPACRGIMQSSIISTGLYLKTEAERLTPVRTGRARSNWHFSGDKPILDVSGVESGMGKIEFGDPNTVVWFLTNNTDYMEYIEGGTDRRPALNIIPQINAMMIPVYNTFMTEELRGVGLAS